jgi:hypothetical protein
MTNLLCIFRKCILQRERLNWISKHPGDKCDCPGKWPSPIYSPLLCFAQVSSAVAQNKPIAPVEDLKVL